MIAILSDFGDSEYNGVMKGVIYSIKKDAKVIDIFNKVSPQNIREGAWILLNSYKYFPKNTIFLCVVDPGVGSERNPIAIRTKNYLFVGPDNGLMYPAADKDGILQVIKLKTGKGISKTFHGRDVFAKAAGEIENNIDIKKLGAITKIKNEIKFYLDKRTGEIVRIDSFGNIITNLKPLTKSSYIINYNNLTKKLNFYGTYEDAKENELFLILGSCRTLEISLKNGNARQMLKVKVNDRIEIK